MPLKFRCEHCRQKLSVPTRKAGSRVTCPACKEPTVVPRPPGAEAPAARPKPAPAETEDVPRPDEHLAETELDLEAAGRGYDETTLDEFSAPVGADDAAESPGERSATTTAPGGRPAREDADDPPPRMSFAKRGGDDEEMDLTPMVDVVFLLLIFFMITASFSRQKSLEVPPPDPEKKGAQQSPEFLDDLEDVSIRVTIDEEDTVRVEDDVVADTSGLADVLVDRMRREDKSELLLSAHDAALHETVVAVIDAAQSAGLQRIRMTSGEPE